MPDHLSEVAQPDWEQISNQIRDRSVAAGLDLVQPLQVGWYNEVVGEQYRLPDFGRDDCLAILVGNTKALWLHFLEAMHNDPDLQTSPHPIDAFTQRCVEAALAPVPCRWLTRYGHKPSHSVALQRLAHVSGLAYLSASHLSVHRDFGPWIALRAACVIDIPGPTNKPTSPPQPCICESQCAPAFRAAMALTDQGKLTQEDVSKQWRSWLAVRDACPVGRIHRYSDAQIRYHYQHDRRLLPSSTT